MIEQIKNWWLFILITLVFVLCNIFCSINNTKDLKDNTYVLNQIYVYFDSNDYYANNEIDIAQIIKSELFLNKVEEKQHLKLDLSDYPHVIVRQDSQSDNVCCINILYTAKTIKQSRDYANAIQVIGNEMIEEILHEDANIICSENDIKKVVIDKNSDINSAMLYTDYVNNKSITANNVLLWCIMGLMVSYAITLVYAIYGIKIRYSSDIKELVSQSISVNTPKSLDGIITKHISIEQGIKSNVPLVCFNMSKKINIVGMIQSLYSNEILKINYDDVIFNLKQHKGFNRMLNDNDLEVNKIVVQVKSLYELDNMICIFEDRCHIVICIDCGKLKVRQLRKSIYSMINNNRIKNNISIVLN